MQNKRWAVMVIFAMLTVMVISACGGSSDSDTTATGSETTVEQDAAADSAAESNEADASESEASGSSSAAATGMRTFAIVSEESTASYVVQEEFFAGALSKLGIDAGNVEVTGTSGDVAGQLQLDLGSDAPLGTNEFTVNLSQFATDQDRRDNWLRDKGPGFGSAPPAKFVANGIDGAPADYSDGQEVTFILNGDLTIKDVTNPVAFSVTATLDGGTISGTASTPSKLTDWNIEPPNFANTLTVADEFEMRIDFIAKE